MREALFSAWGSRVPGARFLDLFAGSGAVGMEALGRGCDQVLLLEGNPGVLEVLKRNCRSLDPLGWEVRRCDVPGCLAVIEGAQAGPFELIFADPPYRFEEHEALLLAASRLLAPGGELALEHDQRHGVVPESAGPLDLVRQRRYGESILSFFSEPFDHLA